MKKAVNQVETLLVVVAVRMTDLAHVPVYRYREGLS